MLQTWNDKNWEDNTIKISKILNNNAVVIFDDKNTEKIVIGSGIAYQKKKGDMINPVDVEKTFYLSSNVQSAQFQEVLVSLPLDQLYIIDKIINEIKLNIGKKISDSIYISLADHINFALKNYSKGIEVSNSILLDIMRFYPDEYSLGIKGLEIIKNETGVSLSNDEAGFIALHIVNAETQNDPKTQDVYKSTLIIKKVLSIIEEFFKIEIQINSLTYYRLLNHLRYFSMRIVNGDIFRNSSDESDLLRIIMKKYKESYMCSLLIKEFIKKDYAVDIGEEEILYLTIHIQRAIFK